MASALLSSCPKEVEANGFSSQTGKRARDFPQLAHTPPEDIAPLGGLTLSLDKKLHIAVSYAATVTGALILQKFDVPSWLSITISGLATLAAGTVKEVLFDNRFSWADQGANAVGVGAGAVFVLVLEI